MPCCEAFFGPRPPFAAAGRVGHGVGFVKDDNPVEVGAKPGHDLVQARGPAPRAGCRSVA